MKKRLIATALLLVLSLAITGLGANLTRSISGTSGVSIVLDGGKLDYVYPDGTKAEPFLSDAGVTYLPVRAIAEGLGLDVDWDPDTMTVTLDSDKPDKPAEPDTAAVTTPEITYAAAYADVFEALQNTGYGGYRNAMAVEEAMAAGVPAPEVFAEAEMPVEAPAMDPGLWEDAGKAEAGTEDYSHTNAQVAGIDEGDIVKTDGKSIYVLRDGELLIFQANGENTELLSTTQIGHQDEQDGRFGYDYYYRSNSKDPYELYVSGSCLAVLSNAWEYVDYSELDGGYYWDDSTHLCVDIYDVSDPAKPVLTGSLGQDGYNVASRLYDGQLYLVSSYSVWNFDDDPRSYVPCVYSGDTAEALPAGRIAILPECGSTYSVVCVYDLDQNSVSDQFCVLGGSDQVYMSQDNLYLTTQVYHEYETDRWQESVYTVEEHGSGTDTELLRLALDADLTIDAAGAVPGYLDSQFSMDEYDGTLRLVTTQSGSRWRTYTDEDYDFVNYEWDDYEETNALWVLDLNLDTIGSVEDLGEGELVYSARFDGEIAYFCTFRNTDPLFAVDLTDPENPQVRSELKISGFSDYLHPWTDDLLFGFGMEADEDSGWTEELKLVMFNTSDPWDVFVDDTRLVEDETWSIALDNHKALLIDQPKNLICFPAGEHFYVYSYDADRGFTEEASLDLKVSSYNARALYIGDYLYIVSPEAIAVLDMQTLRILTELDIARD